MHHWLEQRIGRMRMYNMQLFLINDPVCIFCTGTKDRADPIPKDLFKECIGKIIGIPDRYLRAGKCGRRRNDIKSIVAFFPLKRKGFWKILFCGWINRISLLNQLTRALSSKLL